MYDRLLGRAPRSAVCASLLALLALLPCTGCGSSSEGVRAAVQGKVTLDGKPLEAAAIVFHCGQGEGKITAFGLVENGSFEIAAEEGPLVGKARVEFQPKPIDQATFEEELDKTTSRRRSRPKLTVVDIPLQYGPESTLTAHVTEDGENTFDFALETRR